MIVHVGNSLYSLPPKFFSQSGIFQHTARTFHDRSVGAFCAAILYE